MRSLGPVLVEFFFPAAYLEDRIEALLACQPDPRFSRKDSRYLLRQLTSFEKLRFQGRMQLSLRDSWTLVPSREKKSCQVRQTEGAEEVPLSLSGLWKRLYSLQRRTLLSRIILTPAWKQIITLSWNFRSRSRAQAQLGARMRIPTDWLRVD